MKLEKTWILTFIFLGGFLFSGCGQTVRLYSGRELPFYRVATLMVPKNGTQLKVDGKPVEWERKKRWADAELLVGANRIDIQMLPGSHKIEWSWTYPAISFTYYGSGTLNAETGKKYEIYYDYLEEGRRLVDYHTTGAYETHTYQITVKDYATWIEQEYPEKVVIGTKPEWADHYYGGR